MGVYEPLEDNVTCRLTLPRNAADAQDTPPFDSTPRGSSVGAGGTAASEFPHSTRILGQLHESAPPSKR